MANWEDDQSIWGKAPASGRKPWDRFMDSYRAASVGNPIGGGGMARVLMENTGIGLPDEVRKLPRAQRKAILDKATKQYGEEAARREQADPSFGNGVWDSLSDDNIGKAAASLAGGLLGGVDPTYLFNPGATVAKRVAAQAGGQAVAGLARQGLDIKDNIRDKLSWEDIGTDALAGAAFQGAGELVHGVAGVVRSRKTAALIRDGSSHPDFNKMIPITIHTESRGNSNAVSPKGARGRLQVMPGTDRDPGFGIKASDGSKADTERVGRQYLAAMMGRYGGDQEKAWAAYNWGPGNLDRAVKKHGDDWYRAAPRETQDYVAKNMTALGRSPERRANIDIEINKPTDLNSNGDLIHPSMAEQPIGPEDLAMLEGGDLGLTDVRPDPFGGRVPVDPAVNLEDFRVQKSRDERQARYEANKAGQIGQTNDSYWNSRTLLDSVKNGEFNDVDRLKTIRQDILDSLNHDRGLHPEERPILKDTLDTIDAAVANLGERPLPRSDGTRNVVGNGETHIAANDENALQPGEGTFSQHEQQQEARLDGHEGDPIPVAEYDESHPVRKLVEALRTAKRTRGEQEKLVHQEKRRRVAAMGAIYDKGGPGKEAAMTALGQLKGEYPKADFESIAHHFSEHDVDELFGMLNSSNRLNPLSKATGASGLLKMLGSKGGGVPTKSELEVLGKVFPKDLLDALRSNRPFMEKFWDNFVNTATISRSLMSTMDLSAPLRQGVFMVGRKEFYTSFADMFRAFGSEKAFQAIQDGIESRPTFVRMEEAGLALSNIGDDLSKREEAFMSSFAEKIPVIGGLVKRSDRAYVGFLNKLRADVFDTMHKQGQMMGIDFDADPRALKDTAKFINAATGRGKFSDILGFSMGEHDPLKKLDQAAPLLNTGLFSPRLMASRLTLLNPMFYATLHPLARKEALKSLFAFSAVSMMVLSLAKYNGLSVEADPRSSDFGAIKVGNTRFDTLGGFKQYITYASRMITGETISQKGKLKKLEKGFGKDTRVDVTGRFLRGKEAPIPSFIHDMMADWTNVVGEDQTLKSEAISHFTPMNFQSVREAYDEWSHDSQDPARGIAAGAGVLIPSTFGVGVNTYKPKESKAKENKSENKTWEDIGSGASWDEVGEPKLKKDGTPRKVRASSWEDL